MLVTALRMPSMFGTSMIRQLFQNAFSNEPGETRAAQSGVLWSVGTPLLIFPALTFALTTALFTAGGAITPLSAWLILFLSVAGALLLPRLFLPGTWPLAPVISLGLGALALIVSGLIQDTSIDGQHYHFQAIYALAEGWNPVYGEAAPPVIGDPITLWAVHYPRAGWVFSANLFAAGFPLASVKALNFLVLFASAALVAGTLFRCGFSWLSAALLTAVAILNPVVLSQLFTSMNDGLFGLCMLLFAVSMVVWVRDGDRLAALAGLIAMMLALNLKFSAVPIFVILCAFACAGTYLTRGQRSAIGVGAVLFSGAAVAIVLLGWSPYMRNFLDFGHVFHPIMGAQAVDIMSGEIPALNNTPEVLENLSAAERFLFSLFSETHAGYNTTPHLKIPFLMSAQELRAAGGVDVRLGGFGPFFSGVFVLAVACALALILRPRWRNRTTLGLLLIAGALLFSVLVMPQNWWARYVPQFWLVPLCIAAAAISTEKRAVQILGTVIAAAMLFNATLVGASGFWLTAKRHVEASAQVGMMAASGNTYCVYPDMVQSRIHVMREAGITVRYTPPDAVSCAAPEELAGYGPDRFGGAICVCPE